jgi:DNA-binding response OmpR family regulator
MPKKLILIIDDEKPMRRLLEKYLSDRYEVRAVNDGMEGLEWMQAGNLPDLIIADIDMPRIDGYMFIENVRASGFFREIPIMMLSGIEASAERIRCLRMGADDYMVKPFNPEELTVKIEILLGRRTEVW